MKIFLMGLLLFLPTSSEAKRRREDIKNATETAAAADTQLRTNPALTPEQRTEQERIKSDAVQQIETIGNSEPADTETQLDVSKSLASVSEAPRAIPYAERGLALAEKSGDPKLLREALLTGADVYRRAGNYDLSRQRAERILKQNPQDKDAMMLYMQVKGRGAPSPDGQAGSGRSDTKTAAPGEQAGQKAGSGRSDAKTAANTAGVALTSANALEARRQLELGRSKLALDPAAALRHFDAAVQNDEKDADARAERGRARLAAGDAAGARSDADAALRLAPQKADAYALRAEANQALSASEEEIRADYEKAAALDVRFRDAYEALVARAAGGVQAGAKNAAGSSAPDDIRGPMSKLPEPVRRYGLIGVFAGGLGCTAAALLFMKKRSDEDGSPQG